MPRFPLRRFSRFRTIKRAYTKYRFPRLFIVVHAVENLHMFKGPDDFNGYDYFSVRLYWTGFGFQADIVEEYVLLSAVLHIFFGLK